MPDQKSLPSETVLEGIPARALELLRGIARNEVIKGLMFDVGYTPEVNTRGWDLLHEASGYTEKPASPPERSAAFIAMETLDAWDESGFRRIRAALEHMHPEQATFIFGDGLAASTGPASVIGVKKLVDRLDELESGKTRKATRKEDQAAIDLLTERGITPQERTRLRKLVEAAQTMVAPAAVKPSIDAAAQAAALLKLHAWYKDWSNTAHSVITKRSHLITLGLAKRKEPEKKPE